MEDRSSAFQALKPVCIKLSQSALSLSNRRSSPGEVARAQTDVLNVLTSISKSNSAALNHQMADYVFFPLSHVLRQHSQLPARALEDALSCTGILLKTSWRAQLEPKLGAQLIILLTILVDGGSSSGKAKSKPTEELQIVIQQCFTDVFSALAKTKEGREILLGTSTLPQLGKAIFEILTALKDGPSAQIQQAALASLQAFIAAIDDDDALATSFFPGFVSALQKVLLPTATAPRTAKLLTGSLEALSDLLIRTMSDSKTKDLPATGSRAVGSKGKLMSQLDQSWLTATAGQVKTVLATVVKLRSHARVEVRAALLMLCLRLLSYCRRSLADSTTFLLETVIRLLSTDKDRSALSELQTMLALDVDLADTLSNSIHGWLLSLPRIMQSKDDSAKTQMVLQISQAYQMLSEGGFGLSVIDRLLSDQLRDSVASSLKQPARSRVVDTTLTESDYPQELTLSFKEANMHFASTLAYDSTSLAAMKDLSTLLQTLAASPSGITVTRQLVSSIEQTEGQPQLASFWSSLALIRMSLEDQADVDQFLALPSSTQDQSQDMLEELYAISLEYIDPSVFEEERDWRLKAMSLEAIALYAEQHKVDFRSELVDSLYPVVHLMGSTNPALRHHAIICLNVVASASGYADAKELIIANVDYLVNAVALKLNTFDISAQAPQVLLMMIKLTGPRLLSYLDDLVDSMFAALDAYHGYPKLVQTIFTVLLAIAQEGAKTEQLAITSDELDKTEARPAQTSVADVANTLQALKRKRLQSGSSAELEDKTGHPARPWKSTKSETDALANGTGFEAAMEEEKPEAVPASGDHSDVDSKPPAPKTFAILLKISELTQHYLTASSPSLRTSLLALLHATFPALSKHENSFLPLINTLWPTVVSRLEDEEAYVVANALETISVMCIYAGDFMRSRVVALWPELSKLAKTRARLGVRHRQHSSRRASAVLPKAYSSAGSTIALRGGTETMSGPSSTYIDAPTRTLQDAIFTLVKAIVERVAINADIFEEMLDVTGEHLMVREDVREVLGHCNADAVWLKAMRLQPSTAIELPSVPVSKSPAAQPWPFVDVA